MVDFTLKRSLQKDVVKAERGGESNLDFVMTNNKVYDVSGQDIEAEESEQSNCHCQSNGSLLNWS